MRTRYVRVEKSQTRFTPNFAQLGNSQVFLPQSLSQPMMSSPYVFEDIIVVAILVCLAALALPVRPQATQEFTIGEVEAGPFVIYEGNVYDVSTFRHPGGARRLQQWVGKDATDVLNRHHSSRERAHLEDLLVGVLVE